MSENNNNKNKFIQAIDTFGREPLIKAENQAFKGLKYTSNQVGQGFNNPIGSLFWLFVILFVLSSMLSPNGTKWDDKPKNEVAPVSQEGAINSGVSETKAIEPEVSLSDRLNKEIKQVEDYNLIANANEAKSTPVSAVAVSQKTNNLDLKKLDAKIDQMEPPKHGKTNKITVPYMQAFVDAGCNEHHLLSILAISGHETEFGRTAPSYMEFNYIGFFWGGNKRYDPDLATYAAKVCYQFANDYHGQILDTNGNIPAKWRAEKYSGKDRTVIWMRNVSKFYKELKASL